MLLRQGDGALLVAPLQRVQQRFVRVFLGDPPPGMVEQHRRAAGVFDLFRTQVKAGMTVREVNRRVFETDMVTNLESLFNTWLIDTLVHGPDGARVLSDIPLRVFAV